MTPFWTQKGPPNTTPKGPQKGPQKDPSPGGGLGDHWPVPFTPRYGAPLIRMVATDGPSCGALIGPNRRQKGPKKGPPKGPQKGGQKGVQKGAKKGPKTVKKGVFTFGPFCARIFHGYFKKWVDMRNAKSQNAPKQRAYQRGLNPRNAQNWESGIWPPRAKYPPRGDFGVNLRWKSPPAIEVASIGAKILTSRSEIFSPYNNSRARVVGFALFNPQNKALHLYRLWFLNRTIVGNN